MGTDLTPYDVVIASPPCNYYSRANYRRETSEYSQKTKHLLPDILKKVEALGKPYLVENVRNMAKMGEIIEQSKGFVYFIGRHTYFTNVLLPSLSQEKDNIQNLSTVTRQGGKNVQEVIEIFLSQLEQ